MTPFLPIWDHYTAEDISALGERGDIGSLTKLLGHRNPDIQWRAAEALEKAGPAATGALIGCLKNPRIRVRLGALEALAGIRDPACTASVIAVLEHDPDTEVRWAAAVSLGQIGDKTVVPHLVQKLDHPDKYVRFGAAGALTNLGWVPDDPEQDASHKIALQDWAAVRKLGKPAVPVLIRALSDKDRDVRKRAVEILGDLRVPEARQACDRALSDPDGGVRWKAVLTSTKCRVPMIDLPLHVSHRPRTRPNPYGAAILNLFFLGNGYNYLGKWWGSLIFMSYLTLMVIASLEISTDLPLFGVYPNIYTYPVTAIFAYHAYRMAKRLPDL